MNGGDVSSSHRYHAQLPSGAIAPISAADLEARDEEVVPRLHRWNDEFVLPLARHATQRGLVRRDAILIVLERGKQHYRVPGRIRGSIVSGERDASCHAAQALSR